MFLRSSTLDSASVCLPLDDPHTFEEHWPVALCSIPLFAIADFFSYDPNEVVQFRKKNYRGHIASSLVYDIKILTEESAK